MYYLGIDLGGTNIAVGVVDEENNIIANAKSKTQVPCSDDELADQLASTALEALKSVNLTVENVPWIGVGTPGSVNRDDGVVKFAGNLHLKNFPLQRLLEARLHKEVIVENDANAAAYGEYIAGALKGACNALAITLGTGIGGGIIIDGKVYSGTNCAAGEMGHMVIVQNGRPCTCGRKGCWETYASASGLILTTKEHLQKASKDAPIWKIIEEADGKINGRTAFNAMRAGDPVGKAIVAEYISSLSCGITNCVNIFQPDILCIGGGISNEGETLLVPVRSYVERESFTTFGKATEIRKADLGNDAGIIGAALLGK